MDFALNEHQQDVQRRARAFAASQIAPVASALDRSGQHSARSSSTARPTSGCSDASTISSPTWPASSRFRKSGPRSAPSSPCTIRSSAIRSRATADAAQKKSYLSRLTEQKQLGCYAFAEPSAGSDAGAIRTTAVADGDHFVLNGHKRFVTSGRHARIAIVYALTDPSRGRDGLSAFIVETDTPGFAVGETNEMLGLRASEAVDVLLRDCRVPKGNLLGALNQGFAIAREIVEGGRIDIAAQAVGIGEACLAQSIAKAKDRRQFGRPIAEFEAIQWMVADMSTEIDAARLLAFRAAAMRAKNPDDAGLTKAAAMAKLFASEAANRAAYNALQIFGGHGYLTEYPVERYFRDARAMTLYEETSEIERW